MGNSRSWFGRAIAIYLGISTVLWLASGVWLAAAYSLTVGLWVLPDRRRSPLGTQQLICLAVILMSFISLVASGFLTITLPDGSLYETNLFGRLLTGAIALLALWELQSLRTGNIIPEEEPDPNTPR